jgi:hypothetical protein
LLMAAVATFITTTWSGWLCLMVLFVNLGVVVTLNHSGVIGDCVRRLRLWLGWKDNTAQLLTPKFGKESDLWVRFDEESVWWKERFFRCIRQKDPRSAVCFRSAREQLR